MTGRPEQLEERGERKTEDEVADYIMQGHISHYKDLGFMVKEMQLSECFKWRSDMI